ncbi:MAG: sodium/solute symporter [Phycisphaerales bacterium]|nr:sodium/solute symporter [Phycisphaerales bacterium]
MLLATVPQTNPNFTWLDWAVIAVYLVLTTWIGARLSGKQSTIREFFLGGRKLPWWAICGSIIATEISGVTFLAVPVISFVEGGNLTYLQLGIGAILARVIIGVLFVPQYYQKEIYSPYDYLGRRLGPRVKTITTLLFFVGGILGQGARVFVTAFLLSRIGNLNLVTSIWVIGLFSVGWTLMGGITTVIWTDVIQFCVLILGAVICLFFAVQTVPGGISEVVNLANADDVRKFELFDLRTDPSLEYTLWSALMAFTLLNLAAFGLDQVMAQRMFCCKTAREAKTAIIWSSAGQLVALLMLCVGIALYAYFQHKPFTPEEQEKKKKKRTYLLPIFIVRELPVAVRGLITAAVFAAAISSLDSALAALSQTTVSAFKKPVSKITKKLKLNSSRQLSDIKLSKILVVFWGAVLCLMATACIAISDQYKNVVDLAFGLTAYTYGALLGVFLLALLPVNRDDAGLTWAVPMTVLTVFGLSVHVDSIHIPKLNVHFNWADWVVWIGAAVILSRALLRLKGDLKRIVIVVVGALTLVLLHDLELAGEHGQIKYLSWAWSFPIGTAMTFLIGYGLGNPAKGQR